MTNSEVTREFNHNIPNEISSEVKLTKGITMKALVVVLVIWLVLASFSSIVHPNLQLLYTLFALLFAIIMVLPSSKSPNKLFYETLVITFAKDNTVFHPIEEWEVPDDEKTN